MINQIRSCLLCYGGLVFAGLSILIGVAAFAADRKPFVVVSITPQRFIVDQLAGDNVNVEVMIPSGANHHTFEPTLTQIRAVVDGSIYFSVGHPNFTFEAAWLNRFLAQNPKLKVVNTSADLPRDGDPHVWLSASNVKAMAQIMSKALIDTLPQKRDVIAKNLNTFLAKVDESDVRLRQMLAPKKGMRFLVFHPAWGVFAKEYGLEQIAVEHEGKEPSLRELEELAGKVQSLGLKVIFVEPGFSKEEASAFAQQIGGRTEEANPLAYDWFSMMNNFARLVAENAR